MSGPLLQVASPIVKAVIGTAASIIKQKYQLLQGVEEDIKTLERKLTAIQSVLEYAEQKQLDELPLRDWLGKLKQKVYDADDVLETFATEAYLWQKKQQVRVLRPPFSAREIAFKIEAAKEIKHILEELDQIAKDKEQFNLKVEDNRETPERNLNANINRETSEIGHVFGREDDKNKIVDMLLSEELDIEGDISVLPIIGMGGLGKTTLAQVVFNDDRVKNHFEFRMWVSVTVNFDYRSILKEMIEFHSEMKYDINSLSDELLESRLLEFLARKCFLVVLDDIWIQRYDVWEKLQKVLKRGGKGCRVLITSRNSRVSDVMGTQPPYLLDYLPEDQCWSLFEKIAFKQQNMAGNVRRDLQDIGREIVHKCKGLPLAVKAMAGLLRGNTVVNKWQKILQNEIWEADEPMVLPALKLSYDHLPSDLKQCFEYCYMFPKAYVFDKNELVKLWKAESFIHPREGYTADETGSDHFDELFMRSFFQLLNMDNEQRYMMHDLIHDLAHSVSRPHCYQVKDNESCQVSQSSRYVSLLCKDVEKPALQVIDNSKRLRTLLLPTEYLKDFGQALDKMFNTLKYIRTLDLSSSKLTNLPNSIEKLKLLHYLDLSRTEIKALPNSICSLYNLQTLKLLGCLWLFELPKDLGNLVNLQHLELDDMFWFKSSTLPPRMGNLTSLQNLHAFHISHESGYGIDELKDMKCLNGSLHISKLENAVNAADAKLKDKERLKKVVLEWSNNDGGPQEDGAADERVLEDLQPHSNLQVLQLFCYRGTTFPSWIRDGLLQKLVSLSLNHCSNCKVLSLGQLNHLRELHIKCMLELKEWQEVLYPSLQRLKISNCPKLRKLPQLFPAMRSMKIKKCDMLKTLPLTPFLMFLILVDNLVLEDWNEQSIQFLNGEGQIVMVQVSSYIHLLELKIINCPELQALPEHFAPQKLEISGCQQLSTLPNPEHFRRLQHLALDACHGGTLVRAIPDTSSLYSLVISNITGLTCLPKLPHLSGLKALYISYCNDLVSLSEEETSFQSLPSLKLLSIQNCPQLVTMPVHGLPTAIECLSIGSCPILKSLGSNEMLKNLTSLKDLYIDDCPALQSLPEEGPSTSLQHLHIEGCPLLLEQCQKDRGPDWPKIMHIPDVEFEPIEVSPPQNSPERRHVWYHHFVCCKGIKRESEQSQQLNSHGLMLKDKGQTSKGKTVQ